jgi:hypothetical protein
MEPAAITRNQVARDGIVLDGAGATIEPAAIICSRVIRDGIVLNGAIAIIEPATLSGGIIKFGDYSRFGPNFVIKFTIKGNKSSFR